MIIAAWSSIHLRNRRRQFHEQLRHIPHEPDQQSPGGRDKVKRLQPLSAFRTGVHVAAWLSTRVHWRSSREGLCVLCRRHTGSAAGRYNSSLCWICIVTPFQHLMRVLY